MTIPTGHHTLDPPSQADPASARAAFLSKLADADFCPPEGWVLAVNAIAGANLPVSADARQDDQSQVDIEADEFAAEYWSLPPDLRRQRWANLSARCTGGATSAFLKHLEAGLDVQPVPSDDPVLDELMAVLREGYVLRTRSRAVHRAAWLDERSAAVKDWDAIVGRLWQTTPTTAEFDPSLVTFLDMPNRPPTTVRADKKRRGPTANDQLVSRMVEAEKPVSTSGGRGFNLNGGWLAGGGLFLVVAVIRLCVGGMSGTSPPRVDPVPYQRTPTYSPVVPSQADFPKADFGSKLNFSFTAEQISRFKSYEQVTPKPAEPPQRYSLWVLSGRPDTPNVPPKSQPSPQTPPTRR